MESKKLERKVKSIVSMSYGLNFSISNFLISC